MAVTSMDQLRQRVKVAVLMGGPSAEHAISLKSGQGVEAALRQRGWRAHPLVIPQELTVVRAGDCVRQGFARDPTDAVFIVLHGPFGEDGTIQRLCEELGMTYTGSDAAASALGMDKVASRRRFERAGLRVPRWALVDLSVESTLKHALSALQLPVVVKPTNQGSSIGVSIVTHPEALDVAVEQAARYDTRLLMEEFIAGRELTVGILEDQALPVVEIRPRHLFFDYTAKYTPGQTQYVVPAPLDAAITRRVQLAGLRAHHALGCRDVSRVDLILDESNQPVILEVNTIPGFTATSLLPKAAVCAGLSYDEVCERLLVLAVQRRQPSPQKAASLNVAS